jgi:hypothetical protein
MATKRSDAEPAGGGELPPDERRFLGILPKSGEGITNPKARALFGESAEVYDRVRKSLRDKGLILLGVGRGGRVMLPVVGTKVEPAPKKERDLYDGFLKKVENWASDEAFPDSRFVEVIASQGSRATGGVWTRPDVVLVSVGQYVYVPGKILDITTFEVKTKENRGITAVFEAAAHSRFATKSYLAIEHSAADEKDEDLVRIEDECARFEIGLAYFTDKEPISVYLDPVRREPDPRDVQKFVETQISPLNAKQLALWVK